MDDTEFNEGVKIYINQLTEFPVETLRSVKWVNFAEYAKPYMTDEELGAVEQAEREANRQRMTHRAMEILLKVDERAARGGQGVLSVADITNSSLEILEGQLSMANRVAQRQDLREAAQQYANPIMYTGIGDTTTGTWVPEKIL
jgi:hypothetical protein